MADLFPSSFPLTTNGTFKQFSQFPYPIAFLPFPKAYRAVSTLRIVRPKATLYNV